MGFVLVTLYMGPIGLLLYVMADKEPRPGGHEEFVKPLWKQGVGSTVQIKVIRSTRRSSTASTSLPVRQDKKSGSTRSAGWPKRPAFRSLRAGEGPHAL